MNYINAILSGLAAVFVAECVLFWPILSGSKATGLAVLKALLIESILSPRFWIVGVLLFALFFAASRSNTFLRVLFFWIPTVTVSALGFSIAALYFTHISSSEFLDISDGRPSRPVPPNPGQGLIQNQKILT